MKKLLLAYSSMIFPQKAISHLFKSFLFAFLLLGAFTNVKANNTMGGGAYGTTANLNASQTNVAILGFDAATTNNGVSISGFGFTVNSTAGAFLNTYFTNIKLYTNGAPTMTGATQVTSAAFTGLGTTNPAVTFTAANLNRTGTPIYYFVVVTYVPPSPSYGDTFSLDVTSGTFSDGPLNQTADGLAYTIPSTYDTVTLTSLGAAGASPTNGLSANPITIAQTNIPVYGFSLVGSGTGTTQTITALSFINTKGGGNNSTFFSTVSLYSSTSSTFPGVGNSGATLVTSMAASTTSPANTFTGLSISVPTGTTLYYFVVISNVLKTAANFEFAYNGAGENILTAPTYLGFDYSIDNIYLGAATTTGLASNPLATTQTGIAIASFSVVNGSAANIKLATIAFTNTQPSTYMAGYKLYVNTTNSFTGVGLVPATFSSTTSTIPTFTPEPVVTIPANTTFYFFVVVNYTYPNPATPSIYQLTATSITTSGPGAATYTGGAPQAGPLYTIPVKAPSITYTTPTVPPYTFYEGITLTAAQYPTPTNSGGAIPTGGYSISPTLPAGLSFDASTGIISGTPTATSTGTYTVTATNTGGSSSYGPFTINVVLPAAPSITYSSPAPTYVFTQNVVLTVATDPTPTSIGGPLPSANAYSYTGTLPTNLIFDTNTGVISGTPTATTAATSITVTATNAGGTSSATFTIQVYPPVPTIAYTGSPFTYYVGVPITTLTPATTPVAPNEPTIFTISPSLNTNTGLTFNTSTGVISGTPTTASAQTTYTVTASNANPTAGTTTIKITVLAAPALVYSGTPYTYVQGTAATIAITNNGGAPTSTYALTGTLPTGMDYSSTTGLFTLPNNNTIAVGTYSFTVTANNPAGPSSAPISITINPKAPNITYTSPNTWTVGTAYTLNPNSTGGAVSTWSYTGTLPPGIGFSTTNGSIFGNPTTPGSYSVIVTAMNVTNSSSKTVAFTIDYPSPVITYSPANPYSSGASISLPVTNSEAAVTTGYTHTGTLPTGVTLDGSTGTISGTLPIVTTSTAATYTVSVTASTGSSTGSTPVSIIINPFPPAFAYSSPNVYTVNVAHSALTPSPAAGSGAVAGPGTYLGTALLTSTAGNGSLDNPYGMAVDASGNVYVVNDNGASSTVTEYSATGPTITVFSSGIPSGAIGIVFDSSGNAYVLGQTSKSVVKFTGGLSGTASTIISGLNTPTGIAYYGATNTLYIADSGTNNITEYPTTGGTATFTITPPNNIFGVPDGVSGGVAVDASGNVYVADNKYDVLGAGVDEYSPAGALTKEQLIGSPLIGTNISGLYIDGSGNIYATDAGGKTATVYTAGFASTIVQETGFGSPRGVVADQLGNFYVSDYSNKTVTKYTPASGYFLSGPLPPGLSFNTTTGQITGTATTAFPTTSYTVTAYNAGGSGTSNVFTISCNISFDWVGTQPGGDWNTIANWGSKIIPGTADTAKIGVNNTFTYAPVVATSGASPVSVGWVLMGNAGGQAAGITVNSPYTLNVLNDITKQSDANSNLGYVSYLAGTGIVKAVNVNVVSNTTGTAAYTESISSAVTSLLLSGNIALTSNMGATYTENAAFNVTGGVTSLTGTGATGIISTTNQTGSSSTIGVSAGTLQWANSTGLSGLSATGTNTLACSGTGVIGYSGASQTVYTDLTVTGLPAGVTYQGISFSGTGIKTPNGTNTNNLNIAGSFTNSMPNTAGNYVSLYNTIVNFDGSTAQAMAGGIASQTYGSVFKTVNFSNAGTKTMSGNFYVAPTGLLTMSSGAPLVAGDNATSPTTADAYLTLISDPDSTAAVAPIPTGCSISGNVNVQRYISGDRSYRLMSSAVSASGSPNGTASMNYLLNSLYLTGPGPGFSATGNPTLFLYNESFVPQYSTFYNSNFVAVSSMSTGTGASPTYPVYTNGAGLTGSYTVPAGNGYYVFYRGNLSEGTANLTSPTYSPVLGTVSTATGTLNQGQVNFAAWYAPVSSTFGGVSQYWYLIGNPYASAIDLATVGNSSTSTGIFMTPYVAGATPAASTGITSFIYELNPANGIYAVYNTAGPSTLHASEFIGNGQGFFVEAYGANSSQLVFNESAKANATNANLPPGFMAKRINNLAAINPGVPNPILRLRMTLDSINDEETIITFNPKSSSGFVINEDARHWKGNGLVGFTSISSDNVPLAINSLPLAATLTIPLRTVATNDGLYNISFSQQAAPLPALYDIWLMDAYKKDSLDIKDNPTYNFDILHSDTNSFGDHRFSLVIRQNPALMVHLLSFNAIKATGGDNVLWTTENEANYTNFAVQRSTDGGKTFTTLDALVSSGLGGYSYLDSKPVQGANGYRLQLTDLNGTVTYSNVITIMYANTGNQIALNGFMVYPNPTVGAVNLSINQPAASANTSASASTNYTIQIVNNLGVVLKTAQSSSPQWQTDVSALVPGTYFITVMNTNTNTLVGRSAFVKL